MQIVAYVQHNGRSIYVAAFMTAAGHLRMLFYFKIRHTTVNNGSR